MRFRRLIAYVFALVLLPAQLQAAQNDQVLPLTGLVSGLEFSQLVSDAIAALNTCNSGASAPANATGGAPAIGQCWDDTSAAPTVRKIYDGTSWVRIGALDATNHIWIPQMGGGTATIASGATVDLCSVPQTYVTVTGTTTITSLGVSSCQNGSVKMVRFSGALTLTYNASTLTIPGSADRAIAAGDTVIAVRATSTRWDVVSHETAVVVAGGGGTSDPLPVGTGLTFYGFTLPSSSYKWCDGSAISRTTFPDYLAAVSSTQTVTRANGSPTLTGFTDTGAFGAGMNVEGTGIPAGATILSKTSISVTLSANATSGGSGAVTVFAYGNGNGSSTVSLPDARGRVQAARDDLGGTAVSRLTSAAPNSCAATGLGAACGNQQGTLTTAQLPSTTASGTVSGTAASGGAHTHLIAHDNQPSSSGTGYSGATDILAVKGSQSGGEYTLSAATSGGYDAGATSSSGAHTHTVSGTTSVSFGSGTAHTRLQPTLITNCIVKVLP
jgi:microcystin-dependent protein